MPYPSFFATAYSKGIKNRVIVSFDEKLKKKRRKRKQTYQKKGTLSFYQFYDRLTERKNPKGEIMKKLVLVGICAASLGAPQAKANVCCGFLYACEVIFNLGAGAGMAIYPGLVLSVDPTAIAPRAVGVALFIRGFRQFFSCCQGNNQDGQLNSLKKRVRASENQNWKMNKKLAELQREMIVIKGKLGAIQSHN